MSELLPPSELKGAFLNVAKGIYYTAKIAGKIGYGAYTKSKEKKFQRAVNLAEEANENGDDFNFDRGFEALKNNDFDKAISFFNTSIEERKKATKDFWQ